MGPPRIQRLVALTLAVVVVGVVGCGGTDWVEITGAQASASDAQVVTLLLDTCHPAQQSAPTESVVETSVEIRVTLAMQVSSGDRDSCAGIATIELNTEVGARTVVDARTGQSFDVAFGTPPGAPAATTTVRPEASAPGAQQSEGGLVQYAAALDGTPLREARDPAADAPAVAVERPPLEWWAEYGSDASVAFRLSSHAATFAATIAELAEVGFESDTLALERGSAVGGSFADDSGGPVLVVLDNGSSTLVLLSYELDLAELGAVAERVESIDRATWLTMGGVIE